MPRAKGAVKTGGRQKGTPNKRVMALSVSMQDAAKQVSEELAGLAFQGDAHAFLMRIYKDESRPIDKRIVCAGMAIGYEKGKKAAITVSGDELNPIRTINEVVYTVVQANAPDPGKAVPAHEAGEV
jgi:hypothetical protein